MRFRKSPIAMRFLMIGTSVGLIRYEGSRRSPPSLLPVIVLSLFDWLYAVVLTDDPKSGCCAPVEVVPSGCATTTGFAHLASIQTALGSSLGRFFFSRRINGQFDRDSRFHAIVCVDLNRRYPVKNQPLKLGFGSLDAPNEDLDSPSI